MRLSIDHRTTYRFTEPQARVVQMLRMTPEDTHDQTIAAWRIDVDCDARLKAGRDGFGNKIMMLYAEGPLDEVEIAVSGEVLTADAIGVLRGAQESLPPALFLRPTERTGADAGLREFAGETATSPDGIERLHQLNAALRKRFKIDVGRPEQGLTASAAFARETATSRDMAHMLIAAARSLGTPARYVSGYCQMALEGVTPHGWAEVHVERLGWIGFDPCFGLACDENYVRVAIALDAVGAAPVAGIRLGPGRELLDVDVQVDMVEE
ncbi:transglutaminase family protein [soil metagenome]